jgi:putative sigma-54 modulation protein
MNLDMTGRHVEITPALKDFAEDKLRKLAKLLDEPIEIHVVLGIEKHRHTAEIKVKSRTAILSGTMETGDLYASIGEVADKLERQALKHKEKMRNHKHRRSLRHPDFAASAEPEEEQAEEGASIVQRSRSYAPKPLSLEDAVIALESSGDDVLVYRDIESERINVVYRRSDGEYGLVEPEY